MRLPLAPPILCKLSGDRYRGFEIVATKVLRVEHKRWFHSGFIEIYGVDHRNGMSLPNLSVSAKTLTASP